jgi:hypothetical protein
MPGQLKYPILVQSTIEKKYRGSTPKKILSHIFAKQEPSNPYLVHIKLLNTRVVVIELKISKNSDFYYPII